MTDNKDFLLDVILPKVQALQVEVFKKGKFHMHIDGGTYPFSGRIRFDVVIFDQTPIIIFKTDFGSDWEEVENGDNYNRLYEFVNTL